ncbi:hypothetical protein ACWD4V_13145, partial [Streptomyces tsukubensis]
MSTEAPRWIPGGPTGLGTAALIPVRPAEPPRSGAAPAAADLDLSHADLSRVKVGKEWVELDGGLLPSPFTPK